MVSELHDRAIKAKYLDDNNPKEKRGGWQDTKASVMRNYLYERIQKDDRSRAQRYGKRGQARVVAMTIEAMEVGIPMTRLKIDNKCCLSTSRCTS